MKSTLSILLLFLPALMVTFTQRPSISSTVLIFEMAESRDRNTSEKDCNFPGGNGGCPKSNDS